MNTTVNILNWFEVAVTDYERAKKFYNTIFNIELTTVEAGPFTMGTFPYEGGSGKLSGAIIKGEGYKPSADGALIYFNCAPDLSIALAKVESAGGKILKEKTVIPPNYGFYAIITDTEGNKVALHSNN